jgi:hypothetical protein
MTASVCTSCGAMKIGALTRCTKCKFEASTNEERAKSLLLSDHHLDRVGLKAASDAIQSGPGVEYDEAKVAEMAAGIANAPVPSGIGIVMIAIGFLALLGMVGLMLVLAIRWLITVVAG